MEPQIRFDPNLRTFIAIDDISSNYSEIVEKVINAAHLSTDLPIPTILAYSNERKTFEVLIVRTIICTILIEEYKLEEKFLARFFSPEFERGENIVAEAIKRYNKALYTSPNTDEFRLMMKIQKELNKKFVSNHKNVEKEVLSYPDELEREVCSMPCVADDFINILYKIFETKGVSIELLLSGLRKRDYVVCRRILSFLVYCKYRDEFSLTEIAHFSGSTKNHCDSIYYINQHKKLTMPKVKEYLIFYTEILKLIKQYFAIPQQ